MPTLARVLVVAECSEDIGLQRPAKPLVGRERFEAIRHLRQNSLAYPLTDEANAEPRGVAARSHNERSAEGKIDPGCGVITTAATAHSGMTADDALD